MEDNSLLKELVVIELEGYFPISLHGKLLADLGASVYLLRTPYYNPLLSMMNHFIKMVKVLC